MNTAREEIIHTVERLKSIVIIRGITGDTLLRTVDAIAKGGIGLAEITFDQSGKTDDRQIAYDIRKLRTAFDGKYEPEVLLAWLKNFYRRFFAQQFKRSCLPDGPKVGSVTLSPRGDWRMPSDACNTLWMAELEKLEV